MEIAFVVRCAGGYGEVRIRDTGEVVVSSVSSPGWVVLDGIAFPTEGAAPPRPPRKDIAPLNTAKISDEGDGQLLLFHYTKADTALNHILRDGRLRMGPYANTNDPRESKDWLFALYCNTEIAPTGAALKVSNELTTELKKECRLSCFSGEAVRDKTAAAPGLASTWGRARMWDQYGDRHRGVVLSFRLTSLLRNAVAELSPRGKLFFGRVEYTDPREQRDLFAFAVDYDRWRSSSQEEYAARHLDHYRDWLFFTKNSDWQQEAEYRLLLHSFDPSESFIPIAGALIDVSIGDLFPEDRVLECRTLAEALGARVSRVTWRNGMAVRTPID